MLGMPYLLYEGSRYCLEVHSFLCVCVFAATSPCGVSESLGGGITTLDRDRSEPRLRR